MAEQLREQVGELFRESFKRKLSEFVAKHPDLTQEKLLEIAKRNQPDFFGKAYDYIRFEQQRLGPGHDKLEDIRRMLEDFLKKWDFKI